MPRSEQRKKWRLSTSNENEGELRIIVAGRWCLDQDLPASDSTALEIPAGTRKISFDTAQLSDWDSALLGFLTAIFKRCEKRDIETDRKSLPEGVQHLLDMASAVPEQEVSGRESGKRGLFFQIGTEAISFVAGFPAMIAFLGEVTLSFLRLFTGKAKFQLSDLWWEIEEVGPRALAIVSLISFLVGLILAYLGADQLRLVGAQIFIADLVAIGMVREVGALMTGIIIAGRTGAAFAAQLGTMQVNEEIDAFKTLGISPIDFLVLPRILALMLMVPLLTLYAGFVGILAGLFISTTIFDIGFFAYYNETLRALELKHFLVGLSKGTIYGAVVAFSGCLRGMQCGKSAESVGQAATSAVVTGILLITITASVLTIIYYRFGI